MHRYLIFLFVLFCIIIIGYSQEKSDELGSKIIFKELNDSLNSYSQITIHQDEYIKNLVLNHIEQNKKIRGIPGYRINIFFDSGFDRNGIDARTRARAVKDTFNNYFPHITSYLKYETPNYKVYVGDFRTKTDATKVLKALEYYYPKAFIVNDRIDYMRIY